MIDDLFADSGSEPDFERFVVSEQVESSNSEDDSASGADAESDGEIQTGGLDDADAAAVHQTDPNLPVFCLSVGEVDYTNHQDVKVCKAGLSINPLVAEFFFCYPRIGMEIFFYISSSLLGMEFIFPCLLFGTDFFFGTHVSRTEN